MTIISILLLLVLILLSIESGLHFRSIRKIRIRILVNGARGKSTLVEYLAIALGGEGSTMAKITGVVPTLIYNESRTTISRRGGVRIQEQFRIIREAARRNCDSLILECMSIQPELQKTESGFFRPHLYIITNTRDDHREIEAGTGISYAQSVIAAIPENSTVITLNGKHSGDILKTAEKRNSRVIFADDYLKGKYLHPLPGTVFSENLSIALRACEELNVDVTGARHKILEAESKKPARHFILDQEREIIFLNGFDINDTESTGLYLEKWLSDNPHIQHIIPLLNTRSDRPLRTKLFCDWIMEYSEIQRIIITGDQRKYAERRLLKAGFDRTRLTICRDNPLELILEMAEDKTLVFGIGNIAGEGTKILESLK